MDRKKRIGLQKVLGMHSDRDLRYLRYETRSGLRLTKSYRGNAIQKEVLSSFMNSPNLKELEKRGVQGSKTAMIMVQKATIIKLTNKNDTESVNETARIREIGELKRRTSIQKSYEGMDFDEERVICSQLECNGCVEFKRRISVEIDKHVTDIEKKKKRIKSLRLEIEETEKFVNRMILLVK